jgi:ATP-dependent DNA ligase
MVLPVGPPVAPMLARLARELPVEGRWVYEPKWDGFRCVAFRDGGSIDLRSRHQRPLSRYFPELVAALGALGSPRFVLDGEIVATREGRFDFVALLQRLHPSPSRVERLARETPASFIGFDVLAVGGDDLRPRPFVARRAVLEELLREAKPPLFVTPATTDGAVAARWLDGLDGAGIDGVVAKSEDLPYVAGRRVMTKVKRERSVDCVVGGFRWHHETPTVGSLLLGVYGADGRLHHIGLATSFTASVRRRLLDVVDPLVTSLEGHPWEKGFNVGVGPVGRLPGAASRWAEGRAITWVPVRPELVCEVAYDHLEGDRLRHPARFKRWRPDRDPGSCTYEQFEAAGALSLPKLFAVAST